MSTDDRIAVPSPRIPLDDVIDLAAALTSVGLLAVVVAGGSGPPRILLALTFTFFVPGRAIVTNWPIVAAWSQTAMTMLLSLTVLVLSATVTLWAHLWHPVGLLAAEAGVSVAALAVGIARRRTRRETAISGNSAAAT